MEYSAIWANTEEIGKIEVPLCETHCAIITKGAARDVSIGRLIGYGGDK